MKKIVKSAFLLALSLTVVSSAAMSGCSEANDPEEEVVIPEINYTVSDEDVALYSDAKDDAFSVANVTMREDSPLYGKTIYWLGSSVTYGATSNGEAVADYLAALTGCICKKDAVSGTTIYDDGGTGDSGAKSYSRRLTNSTVFDTEEKIDAFVIQISTNDATNARLSKWGEITAENEIDIDAFDKSTTLGGAEYMLAYILQTWGCPVYFYSGSYFGDEGTRSNSNPKGSNYGELVDKVKQIAEKWNSYDIYQVGVIDLYNDEDFNNAVSDEYYSWCMNDAIHPKNAGYLNWWTPYFENRLIIDLTINTDW